MLFVFLSVLSIVTMGQAGNNYSVSTSTTSGRWEIIQSPILRSHTFKLDKHSGDVCQMVCQGKKDDKVVWEKMKRLSIDFYDPTNEINYQIYISGVTAKDVFLINIHSGRVWTLYKESDKGYNFLAPME